MYQGIQHTCDWISQGWNEIEAYLLGFVCVRPAPKNNSERHQVLAFSVIQSLTPNPKMYHPQIYGNNLHHTNMEKQRKKKKKSAVCHNTFSGSLVLQIPSLTMFYLNCWMCDKNKACCCSMPVSSVHGTEINTVPVSCGTFVIRQLSFLANMYILTRRRSYSDTILAGKRL